MARTINLGNGTVEAYIVQASQVEYLLNCIGEMRQRADEYDAEAVCAAANGEERRAEKANKNAKYYDSRYKGMRAALELLGLPYTQH